MIIPKFPLNYKFYLHGQIFCLSNDRFLYWEFYEQGFHQAVRWRNFKAIRFAPDKPLELYNLKEDPAEKKGIAAKHSDVVAKIEEYLIKARTDSSYWFIETAMEKAAIRNAKKKGKNCEYLSQGIIKAF